MGRNLGENEEQTGFPRRGDPVILIFLLGEEGNLRGVSSVRGEGRPTPPHFPCLQGLVELLVSSPQSSQDLEQLESFLAEKLTRPLSCSAISASSGVRTRAYCSGKELPQAGQRELYFLLHIRAGLTLTDEPSRRTNDLYISLKFKLRNEQ